MVYWDVIVPLTRLFDIGQTDFMLVSELWSVWKLRCMDLFNFDTLKSDPADPSFYQTTLSNSFTRIITFKPKRVWVFMGLPIHIIWPGGSILLPPPAAGASPRLFFTLVKSCSELVLPSVLEDPVIQITPIPCPEPNWPQSWIHLKHTDVLYLADRSPGSYRPIF